MKDRVTLTYLASLQNEILSAVRLERALASLSIQDVAIQLGYPVDVAAEGNTNLSM